MKTKTRLYFGLLILAAIITVVLIFAGKYDAGQRITKIVVEGLKTVPESDIIKQAGEIVIGRSKKNIDLSEVEKLVSEHPFIFKAEASFGSSGKMIIDLEERNPAAILERENGKLNFVDDLGRVLPYKVFHGINSMVILSGFEKNNRLFKGKLKDSIELLAELKKSENKEIFMNISEIIYKENNGIYVLKIIEPAADVILGRYRSVTDKIDRLKIYLNNVNDDGIRTIDLRWNDRVVVS